MSLNAVGGIIWNADVICTDKRAGWVICTGLKTDFIFMLGLNAAWRIICDANITYTDLRAGWVICTGLKNNSIFMFLCIYLGAYLQIERICTSGLAGWAGE